MENNEKTSEMEGLFVSSLKRNNKQIREDRATAIAEDAELCYKRHIEDLEMEIKKKKRDRENMLDLSPSNAQSLVVASDFNAVNFVKKDTELGIAIRNLEIELSLSKERFSSLFGV